MTPRWIGPLVLLACAPHEHPREPQPECAAGMVAVEGSHQGTSAIDRLCVDATEVTTAAYGACVHAGACTPTVVGDVAECNLTRADRGDHPINCVDFEQAHAYCGWLGKRLPNDAEWAHIARPRAVGAAWPWGPAAIDPTRACIGQSGTCPVGQHEAGASVDGVHDLAGGVAEWVVHGERRRLRGGSWRATPGPDLVDPSTVAMAAADTGVRCVVAPFSTVTAPDLEVWTPHAGGPAELPVLAAASPPVAPARPLANLQLLRSDPQQQDPARWWPVGDDWLTGYDGGQPDALGLPDVLERASLPEGLRDFTPVRQLGSDLLLMRTGWASGLRFVAVERAGFKIRWQIAFTSYGSSFEQFIGPRTLVAEIYDQQGDTLVGFGLADGRELWRIAGGEKGPFVRASRIWTDGDRGYVHGDRGLLAFDLVTGQVLWDGVTLDDDCGAVTGDGVMVVEGPEPEGHRRLDAATGAELGRLEGGGDRCVWGIHPTGGGVMPAVLEDSRLFSFTVPDGRGTAVLRVHDLASGRELWRRGGLDPHVLIVDRDAVYVRRARDRLIGLEAATGAPQIEISLAGEFALSLLAGGGPRGPLLLSAGETGNDWLLGRGEQPSAAEAYTVRGRLVPDGLSRRSVAGVPVRVGDKRTRTDAAGRFTLKGVARGAVAVALGNDRGPGEPGGSTVRFEPVTVVLAGRGTYEVGDVPLFAWYTE